MRRHIFLAVLLLCFPSAARAGEAALPPVADDAVNFYCLRSSYPVIRGVAADGAGEWLLLADGRRVLYRAGEKREAAAGEADFYVADVAASMEQPYPLEPQRPETPPGFAPGRRRSYALLDALYGGTAADVERQLRSAAFLGASVRLSAPAARALELVGRQLEPTVRREAGLRAFLKNDGGYFRRNIAGTRRLSPHSYGIALDLSADRAAYWQWSPLRPHPLQRKYPPEIVAAFEAQGFIWGGKWHEFDLMHFEFRPELVCKARMLEARRACRQGALSRGQ